MAWLLLVLLVELGEDVVNPPDRPALLHAPLLDEVVDVDVLVEEVAVLRRADRDRQVLDARIRLTLIASGSPVMRKSST